MNEYWIDSTLSPKVLKKSAQLSCTTTCYHPDYVLPTVKHGEASIMVWGCMVAAGVGKMFVKVV